MGLQKYRADEEGEKNTNGSVAWYSKWVGGPSLALIRNCPVKFRLMDQGVPVSEETIAPRTVYITSEPDTMFSTPAACRYKKKDIRGYVKFETDQGFTFHASIPSSDF